MTEQTDGRTMTFAAKTVNAALGTLVVLASVAGGYAVTKERVANAQADVAQSKVDMAKFSAGVNAQIAAIKSESKFELSALRSESRAEMAELKERTRDSELSIVEHTQQLIAIESTMGRIRDDIKWIREALTK